MSVAAEQQRTGVSESKCSGGRALPLGLHPDHRPDAADAGGRLARQQCRGNLSAARQGLRFRLPLATAPTTTSTRRSSPTTTRTPTPAPHWSAFSTPSSSRSSAASPRPSSVSLSASLRLSKNWLVAKLTMVYVETFRNVPVLMWILLTTTIVNEIAPSPRASARASRPGALVVTNRGIYIPAPHLEAGRISSSRCSRCPSPPSSSCAPRPGSGRWRPANSFRCSGSASRS